MDEKIYSDVKASITNYQKLDSILKDLSAENGRELISLMKSNENLSRPYEEIITAITNSNLSDESQKEILNNLAKKIDDDFEADSEKLKKLIACSINSPQKKHQNSIILGDIDNKETKSKSDLILEKIEDEDEIQNKKVKILFSQKPPEDEDTLKQEILDSDLKNFDETGKTPLMLYIIKGYFQYYSEEILFLLVENSDIYQLDDDCKDALYYRDITNLLEHIAIDTYTQTNTDFYSRNLKDFLNIPDIEEIYSPSWDGDGDEEYGYKIFNESLESILTETPKKEYELNKDLILKNIPRKYNKIDGSFLMADMKTNLKNKRSNKHWTYLIENSYLDYEDEDGNHALMFAFAFNKDQNLNLTDKHFNYLIENSPLNHVNKENYNSLMFAFAYNKVQNLNLNNEQIDYLIKNSSLNIFTDDGLDALSIVLMYNKDQNLNLTSEQFDYLIRKYDYNHKTKTQPFLLSLIYYQTQNLNLSEHHFNYLIDNSNFDYITPIDLVKSLTVYLKNDQIIKFNTQKLFSAIQNKTNTLSLPTSTLNFLNENKYHNTII